MRIMGVDFGDARTGIAVSDPSEFWASPICVIKETEFEETIKKVATLAAEHSVGQIVVGYPKNMNGTIGERAEKSQRFAQGLETITGVPVKLWDERCTTMSAAVYMNATDTHGRKRKNTIDAAAATIILQDFLDYKRNMNV
jgi:putative holliday junction resolvase